MIRFSSLTSGSSGNCLFLSDEKTKILIDTGVSAKKICTLLESIGENICSIDAVLITHEHTDHIAGLSTISSKYNIPVFIKKETYDALNFEIKNKTFIDGEFQIDTLNVIPFDTSHDAISPVGYIVSSDKSKIVIATDLGTVTREQLKLFLGCTALYIESNHDVSMLVANPQYPYPLKRRILSEKGHLSNALCADLATSLALNGTKYIILGHLSRENNSPEIAYETTKASLLVSGIKEDNVEILVAEKDCPTEIIEF